ncbi:aldo/keto reductase [Thermomonospora umbrina]|uniref:Aryl-alcohol dehydrogenase-like predicted oxidoreductase n=1 Tax=Thermomonospora umbrina TaxID=111806 RepID=A0A3D9SZK9_9ACTN|nr:aldo/keto reductase [Thermomonospora umbrina]REF01018.1 aryl-alcohol dehydrogenase-like predicted oxidoreductase [Thermomonospora umbrina]
MEQRHLGRSGLLVSRLGLGTMTWGQETSPDEAAAQLAGFVDAGGTLVDTADVYGDGDSERVLGRLLRDLVPRDDLVVGTKSAIRPNGRYDASRRHLLTALDASLDRLGLEHVDLWQLHVYDPMTPLEETLAALDEAVASGRTRYVGVSNYAGWQLAKAAAWQRAWPGRAPIVSTQMEYSLLHREIEREVVPAAEDAEVGVLPWSPLGRGVLTGKYRTGIPADSRAATTRYAEFVRPYLGEQSRLIVESVSTAAEGLGVSPLAVALSWVRDRPGVVAPIVGARTPSQLLGILQTEDVTLPAEIRDALDDISDV